MKNRMKQPHEIISLHTRIAKPIILMSSLLTLIYLTWWLDFNNSGNPFLYGLLFAGEIYHVVQALGYAHTIWDQKKMRTRKLNTFPRVDVLITVCGEPVDVVEKTVKAAANMDYPNFEVYILNDSYVREKTSGNKTNWQGINELAKKYGVTSITRRKSGGGKSGNVNNALKLINAPFFAQFDADHVPEKTFLTKTMGFFQDEGVALVQTPQYYENRKQSFLTTAAWEQQELFFGPICRGKIRMNATFCCGTNFVARKAAINEVGGFPEDNIAEDFLMSLFIHQNGWKTIYVPEILAKGMAPHDLKSYADQQYRWARGSLEVIFKYNPLFKKGLTWGQKFQYLYSAGYWLNGFVILIDALIPIVALSTGLRPVNDSATDFMIYFFPFILTTIYLLMASTHNTITFRAIQLSMSSFFVLIMAALATIFNKADTFKVTSKTKDGEEGNYLNLAMPHFAYMGLGIIAIAIGIAREGFVPSVITNIAWIVFNSVFFLGFVRAAYPWSKFKIPSGVAYAPGALFRIRPKNKPAEAVIYATNPERNAEE